VGLIGRVGQVGRVGPVGRLTGQVGPVVPARLVGLMERDRAVGTRRRFAVAFGACLGAAMLAGVAPTASAQRGRRSGEPPPVLLAPLTRPAPPPPVRSAPPDQPARPAPPAASAQEKNRLYPAQELGLIEPPDRDQWQPPEQIMDELNIADGAVVADIGAGGGWFTIHLALRVGPNGVVYAEDVQTQMIDAIRRRAQRENLSNVRTVLGTAADPKLPHGLDAALIVDGYHEIACAAKPSCDEPIALLTSVAHALKPQGRLGIVDFYPGAGGPGPAPDERVNPDEVVKAAAAAGLQLITRKPVPPFRFQYLLVFGRTPAPRATP
jgi:predicted methyltransferase